MNEINGLISSNQRELDIAEEKSRALIAEQEIIDGEIQAMPVIQPFDQEEKYFSFPYQSFLNLRHWRKAPKSLKLFFQALACLFSISSMDFLTALKVNHHLKSYQPSSTVMDEFRQKYANGIEISPEYIRTKSFDAYLIAVWVQQIDENERFHRMRHAHLVNQREIEMKLKELHRQSTNKYAEIQIIDQRIRSLKKNLDQTEKHRGILLQSN